jgi:hypothetical protein
MLAIDKTNAMGIKKIAHTALNRAIRGAQFEIQREAKANSAQAEDRVPNIDDYNELVMNERHEQTDDVRLLGPVGHTRKYTDWKQFMHLYIGLAGELAALQEPWALVQDPAAYFDFVYAENQKPFIGEAKMEQLKQLSKACNVPLAEVVKGEQEATLIGNGKIRENRALILGKLSEVTGCGMTEINCFEQHEQAALLGAFIREMDSRKSSYVLKGHASRNPEGWANVMLMEASIVEAKQELQAVSAVGSEAA